MSHKRRNRPAASAPTARHPWRSWDILRRRRPKKRKRTRELRRLAFEPVEERILLAASPGLDPVLFVPGFGGTFAADTSPDGLNEWYTTRGIAPEKLGLEPLGDVYVDIVESLKNVGYVEGETLFVANWDWRVAVAPSDGNHDGVVTGVTGSSISDTTFETGIDYLGHWLSEAADAYAAANGGATLPAVDMITHSTGGLVARSYIQSTAYGDGLPVVDDLVLAGVPSQGLSEAFNFLENDWAKSPASRVLGRIVDQAYDRLQEGQTITGPDGAISDPGIDKTDFIGQYIATLKDLRPTFAVFDANPDDPVAYQPLTGDDANSLGLDLNAGVDSNAFIDLTASTTVVYAQETPTLDRLQLRSGPDPRGFLVDEILPFINYIGRSPLDGQAWIEDIDSGAGGDGTVPAESAVGQYLGDLRTQLTLVEVTEAAAGTVVNHRDLAINPYSQLQILGAVGVTGATEAEMSTAEVNSKARSALNAMALGIVSPGEALGEAADRFRELVQDVADDPLGAFAAALPLVNEALGDKVPVAALLQQQLVDPLAALVGVNPNADADEIAAALGATNVSIPDEEFALAFHFDESDFGSSLSTSYSLDLGGGFSFGPESTFDFDGQLELDFILGIDLTEGFQLSDGLFVRDLVMTVGGEGGFSNLDFTAEIGGFSGSVVGGDLALSAAVAVSLIDPNPDGKVTLAELTEGLRDPGSLVSLSPSGTFDALLPLNLTAPGFDLSAIGTPVITVHSDDLFEGVLEVTVDAELSADLQAEVLNLLLELDNVGDDVSGLPFLNVELPVFASSLNDLLTTPEGNGWGDFLKFHDAVQNYFNESVAMSASPTVRGVIDVLLTEMEAKAAGAFVGTAGGPFQIVGGLDLETNELRFDVLFDAATIIEVDPAFPDLQESLGFRLDVAADAELLLDVVADIDLDFSVGLDLNNLFTGAGLADDDLFLELRAADIAATVDAGLDLGFMLGILQGGVVGGTVQLAADVNGFLTADGVTPLPDPRVPLPDLASGVVSLAVDTTGTLDAEFPLFVSVGGVDLGGGATPIILANSADLFHSPSTITTENFDQLLGFKNLDPATMLNLLVGVGNFLDQYRDSEVFDVAIPFVGADLGDLFDMGNAFIQRVQARLEAPQPIPLSIESVLGQAALSTGQLSGDARFQLVVDDNPPVPVEVFAADTSGNSTADDLVISINAALVTAGLAGVVEASLQAGPSGTELSLATLDPAELLQVLIPTDDSAATLLLGLVDGQSTASTTGGPDSLLLRTAVAASVAANGQLADDVTFQLQIDDQPPVDVTVAAEATDGSDLTDPNQDLADLVFDINAALAGAGLSGQLVVSERTGTPGIVLATTVGNDAQQLTVSIATVAKTELGLVHGDSAALVSEPGASQVAFATFDEFAALLVEALDLPPGVGVDPTYDPVTQELSVAIQFQHDFPALTTDVALDLPLDPLANVDVSGQMELNADALLGFTFGIDLDAVDEQGNRTAEPFIEDASIAAGFAASLLNFSAIADFGFVGLEVGSAAADLTAEATANLVNPGGGTRLTFGDLSDALTKDSQTGQTNAASLATMGLTSSAMLTLGDIAADGGLLSNLGSGSIRINVPDLTMPTNVEVATSGLPSLDSLRNLSLSDILVGLSGAVDLLGNVQGFGFLQQDLPLINKNIGELFDFAEVFASAVERFENDPGAGLAFVEEQLELALGLPSDLVTLSLNVAGGGGIDSVVIDIAHSESFSFDETLALTVDLPGGLGTMAANAMLGLGGELLLDLGLGVDLTNPSSPLPFLTDTTAVTVDFAARAQGVDAGVTLGPVSFDIVGGSLAIDGDGLAATLDDNVRVRVGLKEDTTDGRYLFSELTTLNTSLVDVTVAHSEDSGDTASAGAIFPVVIGGTHLGDITVEVADLLNPTFVVTNGAATAISDLLSGGLLTLLQNPVILVDGLDAVLGTVQSGLDAGFSAIELPVFADALRDGAQVIDTFRSAMLSELRTAIADVDPIDAIQQGLFDLFGGLGILLDFDNPFIVSGGVITGVNPADNRDDVQIRFVDDQGDEVPGGLSDPDVDAVQVDLHLGQNFTETLPLGFDLGLPVVPLGLDVQGGAQFGLTWGFEVGFGISSQDGFYFNTEADNELELSVDLTTPGLAATGELLVFEVTAGDIATDPTHLGGHFGVDLIDSADPGSRLTISELSQGGAGSFLTTSFDADADINLQLELAIPGVDVLPRFLTELHVDWGFGSSSMPSTPTVAFENVQLDLGSFLSDFAKPVLGQVKDIIEPLEPVINVLNKRIPGLSDILGERITLLNMPEAITNALLDLPGSPVTGRIAGISAFLEAFATLPRLVSAVSSAVNELEFGGDTILIDMGSFDLGTADPRNPNTRAQPNTTRTAPDPKTQAESKSSGKPSTRSFLSRLNSASSFLQFPLLTNPANVFQLILGNTVDLFIVDSPRLDVDINIDFTLPIWPAPKAQITFDGSLDFDAHLGMGFDTSGVNRFLKTDNPLDIFDGFFISDRFNANGTGPDVPEVSVSGDLTVGGRVNVFEVVKGKGEGSFGFAGSVDLNDPNNDGKLRFSEMAAIVDAAQNIGEGLLNLFNIMFEVTLEASAHVDVYDVLAFSWDRVFEESFGPESFGFSHTSPQPKPILGSLDADRVLHLHMGDQAISRVIGNVDDGNESFKVRHFSGSAGFEGVELEFAGRKQRFFGVSRIVARAGQGNDTIQVTGIKSNMEFDGGAGDDRLLLDATTTGNATLIGGLGRDILEGGSGRDLLDGGVGIDILRGGPNDDTLLGGDDSDTLEGGPGRDTLDGGAANDTLRGGDDDDTLRGGDGSDTLEGGDGNDLLEGEAGNDTLRGGNHDDTLHGGDGADTLMGDAGADTLHGDAGPDILFGGSENDTLFGGDGDDTLHGDEGEDYLAGENDNDVLLGGQGADVMDGGAGNDTLRGGSEADRLLGGPGDDDLQGEAGADELDGQGDNDLLSGGADGDLYRWANRTGSDTIVDTQGANQLFVSALGSQNRLVEFARGGAGQLTVTSSADTLNATGIVHVVVEPNSGPDEIVVHDLPTLNLSSLTIDMGTHPSRVGDTIRLVGNSSDADLMVVQGEIDAGQQRIRVADGSADAVILNSQRGLDTLVMEGSGGDDQLQVSEGTQGIPVLDLISVRLEGGPGRDIFSTVFSDVTVLGGADDDRLLITDGGLAFAGRAQLTLQSSDLLIRDDGSPLNGRIQFAGVESLQLDAGTVPTDLRVTDTFVSAAAAPAITLRTTAEDDTVRVEQLRASTLIETLGGADSITVGKDQSQALIGADLTLVGGAQDDTLVFEGARQAAARTIDIGTADQQGRLAITGLGGALSADVVYDTDIETLRLTLGLGGDTVVIPDLTRHVIVDDGAATDTVLATVLGSPDGTANGPTLTTNQVERVSLVNQDQPAATVWNLANNVTSVGDQQILTTHGASWTSLTFGGGNDQIRVENVDHETRIDAGGGGDQVTVEDELADIGALLVLDGGAGGNRLILNDRASSQLGLLASDRLTGMGMPPEGAIEFRNFAGDPSNDGLTLNLTGVGHNLTIADTSTTTTVNFTDNADTVLVENTSMATTLNLRAGNDLVEVVAAAGPLTLDGGAGLDDQLRFLGNAYLQPLPGDLSDSGPLAGRLSFAAILPVLDFQNLSGVELQLGSNSDVLTLDLSLPDVAVDVFAGGGDDEIVLRRIGGPSSITGGSGQDTVHVVTTPAVLAGALVTHSTSISTELLRIDDTARSVNTAWNVIDGTVSIGDHAAGTDTAIVSVAGADETRILGGSGVNTLDVGITSGNVQAEINGNRVDIQSGAVILEPADSSAPVLVPQSFELSSVDGSNGLRVDGVNAGQSLGLQGSPTSGDVNGDGIPDLIFRANHLVPTGRANAGAVAVIFGQDTDTFASPFDFSTLDGSNGFVILGAEGDNLAFDAHTIASGGDLNNDDFDDIVIGAPSAGGKKGAVFVVFGRDTFDAVIDLADPQPPAEFKRINGAFEDPSGVVGDQIGLAVGMAGDVNGDDIDDLLFTSGDFTINTHQAAVYVVYGNEDPSLLPNNNDQVNGANGFRIQMGNIDHFELDMDSAGDINNDGTDDIVIAHRFATSAYVIFGRHTDVEGSFPATISVGSSVYGTRLSLPFAAGNTQYREVAGLGDVNGDGIDDVAVGVRDLLTVYVLFGRDVGTDGPFASSISLQNLNGSNGFRLIGKPDILGNEERAGVSVDTAGDVNGDGVGDLLVSAGALDEATAAYLVFGRNTTDPQVIPFPAELQLLGEGVQFVKEDTGEFDRTRVHGIGDFNNDGVDDIVITDSGANPDGNNNAGSIFVIFVNELGDLAVPVSRFEKVVLSPDRNHLYAIDPTQNAAVVLDATDLSPVQTIPFDRISIDDFSGFSDANILADVAIHANGQFVYVTTNKRVATFRRDAPSGVLTLIETTGVTEGLMAFSPTNPNFLFSAEPRAGSGQDLNRVQLSNGAQVGIQGRDIGSPARDIVVSPDGQRVLVALEADFVFQGRYGKGGVHTYNTVDLGIRASQLALVESEGISGLALSPDEQFMYITAAGGGEVYTYRRNISSSTEVFPRMVDGVAGIRGIAGASDIQLSADGQFVFVTGADSDSLVAFLRDEVSGQLEFGQALGSSGTAALQRPAALAIDPVSGAVYTAGAANGLGGRAISRFDPLPFAPPRQFSVSFDSMSQLHVITGDREDHVSLVAPADVSLTRITTAGGDDDVDLLRLGGTTEVDSGAGLDTVHLRSEAANTSLLIETQGDQDHVVIHRSGVLTTTTVDTGDDDDTIEVFGPDLQSDIAVRGGAPLNEQAPHGDRMVFYTGQASAVPANAPHGDGTIGVDDPPGAGQVHYQSVLLDVRDTSIPVINNGQPLSRAEGQSLQLNTDGTIIAGGRAIVEYLWDVNGDGLFGDAVGEAPLLSWADLRELGIDDDGSFDITVRTTDDLDQVVEATGIVVITNVAPVVTVNGTNFTRRVGEPYTINFSATDPGNDTLQGWQVRWGDGTVETFGSDTSAATHAYLDSGNFTAQVVAIDEDGPSLDANAALPVPNYNAARTKFIFPATPDVSIVGSQTGLQTQEGQTVTFQATAPGSPSYFWKINGSAEIAGGPDGQLVRTWSDLQGHGMTDDGDYSISVRAEYSLGSGVRNATLTVLNSAPTAFFAHDGPAQEGDVVSASFTDQVDPSSADQAAGFLYSYDFDNDGVLDVVNSPDAQASFTVSESGVHLVRGLITDKDGGSTEYLVDLAVGEVAPTLVLAGSSQVPEGSPYVLDLSAVDPGDDTITQWDVNWGDGTSETINAATASLSHLYPDDGPFPIAVTARDEDGVYSASRLLAVQNVAPTVALSGSGSPFTGELFTLSIGAVTDPGPDTVTQYLIDWGDGTADAVPTAGDLTHVYSRGGAKNVSVALVDEDGTHPDAGTLAVVVQNIPPTVNLVGGLGFQPGADYLLTLDSVVNPSGVEIAEYVVDWGDGTSDTVGGLGELAHTYTATSTQTISVDVIASDATLFADAASLVVPPVVEAVSLTVDGDAGVVVGQPYTLNFSADVPVSRWVIAWGDGSVEDLPGADTSASHVYLQPGAARISVLAEPTSPVLGQTIGTLLYYSFEPPDTASDQRVSDAAGNGRIGSLNAQGTGAFLFDTAAPTGIGSLQSLQLRENGTGNAARLTRDIPASTLDLNNDDWTFTGWLNRRDADNADIVFHIGAGDGFGPENALMVVATGNSVALQHYNGPADVNISRTGIDPGTWHHVAVTHDAAAGRLSFYVDGQLVGSDESFALAMDQSTPVVFGGHASPTSHLERNFDGGLDQLVLFGRKLDPTEVALAVAGESPLLASTGHSLSVAPATPSAGGPYAIQEGGSLALGGSVAGNALLGWDLNADGIFTDASGPNPGLSWTRLSALGINDDGLFPVSVRAQYADGQTADSTTQLTVGNAAPTARFAALASVTEGHSAVVVFSNTRDASLADAAAGFLYSYDFDNDGTFEVTGSAQKQAVVPTSFIATPGNHTVRGRIADQDGGFSDYLAQVVVNPQLLVLQAPQSVPEGTTLALQLSSKNPLVVSQWTINWGDGSSSTVDSPAATVRHKFRDNGRYTISVRATDGSTNFANSHLLDVSQVAPVLNSQIPAAPKEGRVSTLYLWATDPGDDTVTQWTVNWGDGSQSVVSSATAALNHSYAQDGQYQLNVSARDEDGSYTSSRVVNVQNVAPSVLPLTLSQPVIGEDGTVELTGTFDDPGTLDTHTVLIVWGDGSPDTVIPLTSGERSFAATHQYLDDGPNPGTSASFDYSINATVTDDGGQGSASSTITVSNVAPTQLALSLDQAEINEDGMVELTGTFDDPGTLDTHTVLIVWGDGSPDTVIPLTSGERSFAATHQYLDNGPNPGSSPSFVYTIDASITDDDGGLAEANSTVAVHNVAPSEVVLTFEPESIDEDGTVELTGTFDDPGTLDTHTVLIVWGDGSPDTVIPLTSGERSFTAMHQYLDDGLTPGGSATFDYPVSANVTDNNNESSSGNNSLTVSNVAPVVAPVVGPAFVLLNEMLSFSVTFSDVGTLDTHTCSVDWGDGTSEAGVLTANTCEASHTFTSADPGNPVTFSIEDDDTGVGTSVLSVQVGYDFGEGFLSPLDKHGAYATGRTIPVKFQLSDFHDAAIDDLAAVASIQYDPTNPDGPPQDAASTGSSGLRYTGNKYHFNWDTGGLAEGFYTLIVTLDSGQQITKDLELAAVQGNKKLQGEIVGIASGEAGRLLAGDLYTYVDADLTSEQLARIDEAIAVINPVVDPYGARIFRVDPAQLDWASLTIDQGETSPCGDMQDGVLGCTIDASQVTILSGWDWFTGADASGIDSEQYDYQTVMTHELAHALGVGHSLDPDSVTSGLLPAGVARRTMSADDILFAAGVDLGLEPLLAGNTGLSVQPPAQPGDAALDAVWASMAAGHIPPPRFFEPWRDWDHRDLLGQVQTHRARPAPTFRPDSSDENRLDSHDRPPRRTAATLDTAEVDALFELDGLSTLSEPVTTGPLLPERISKPAQPGDTTEGFRRTHKF